MDSSYHNTFYLYIIYSQKADKLYIGITKDLNRRLFQHNNNLSPYTKNKGPWILVYYEVFNDKKDAMKREREIKNWRSRQKIIKNFNIVL